MILRHSRLIAMAVIFVLLMLPVVAGAQGGIPTRIVPDTCDAPGGCQSICDIVVLAQNVLNYGIFLAVILSSFLFVWAGWNMLTSGGNTEVYAKGKRIFGNVLIGLIIILAGWIVVSTLMNTMTGSTGVWNKICTVVLSHFEHLYA